MSTTRSKSNMSTAAATNTTNTTTTTRPTATTTPTPAATSSVNAPNEPNIERIVRPNYPRIPMPTPTNKNVEAWLKSMDRWFKASGISDADQRSETILASIDPNVLDQITDQLDRMPAEGKYDYTKVTVIAHFADSEQRKLNRLLSEMPLGDKRPSELYHEMKRVAGNVLGETALKGLWAQRLPETCRPVIAATSGSAVEFTRMADTIVDALASRTVQQVAASPLNEINELKAVIAELKTQISNFSRHSRPRSKSNSRQRQRTPSNRNNGTAANNETESDQCWYHEKYGNDARKCRSPCRNRNRANTPAAPSTNNGA